ncbi:MAG: hypothetical protein ACYCOX_13735, partial [Acidobacteriaceae bacterium]
FRPVSNSAAAATKDPAASARNQVISCSISGYSLWQTLSDNRCGRVPFPLRKTGTKSGLRKEAHFRNVAATVQELAGMRLPMRKRLRTLVLNRGDGVPQHLKARQGFELGPRTEVRGLPASSPIEHLKTIFRT